MKIILLAAATFVFSASGLAQTTITASSEQPVPSHHAARAPETTATPASVDALLASINSQLKTSFHTSADNTDIVFSNVVLRAKNGQIKVELDRTEPSGYVSHGEYPANAKDLGTVQYQPFSNSGYWINILCKNDVPCVLPTVKATTLPENINVPIASKKIRALGFIVTNDEDSARAVAQQIDSLLKTMSDPSLRAATDAQLSSLAPESSGPSLDETLAYVSSRVVSEGGQPIQFENGQLTTLSQGAGIHYLTSVSPRHLDGVYYNFHKTCGYHGTCFEVFAVCKDTAKGCVSIKSDYSDTDEMTKTMIRNGNNGKLDEDFHDDKVGFAARDLETAIRLARALDHLIKLVSKEDEQADPFK